MKLENYKKIRVVVSLVFFLLISLVFLDFGNLLPPTVVTYILYLQFVPSLFKFINQFSIAVIGFIVILLLTFFFGRLYCSSICPLGAFQDLISRISKKFIKKKRYRFSKPHNWLRYSILIITILFYLIGSGFLINLLDPYSTFGKIFSNLFRPILIGVNNSLSTIFEKLNIYWLYPYDFRGVSWLAIGFSFSFLVLVFYFSFKYGRLYCNTICPVGTLLGFLSKFSFYKIAIDQATCKGCGVCERVCKSNCIDLKSETREIDFSRCVSCYNCFTVCPTNGIKYSRNKFNKTVDVKSEIEPDINKRTFILSSLVYLIGVNAISFAQNKIIPKKKSTIPILKKYPVSPPGSKSIKKFSGSCTACHLCVSACPTQVLQPSYLEYGFLGILQPRMDYEKSFCNYECALCTEICPTGAISKVTVKEKKTIQLGKANFLKDNCIVYTENTDCGACSEHCPTKAVAMVPYKNLMSPKVNQEICVGCGACEYACPVKPYKAIYVEGNPIHLIAKKPEIKKIEDKVDLKEDFPF